MSCVFVAITPLPEVVEIPQTPAFVPTELLSSETNPGSDFPNEQCGQGDASTVEFTDEAEGCSQNTSSTVSSLEKPGQYMCY